MNKRGKVIQSKGKWYKVSADSSIYDCRLAGKFRLEKKEVTNPIAVGDMIQFKLGEDGTGYIVEIEERVNYIPRQATHGKRGEQILISNIDRAWVVQSVISPRLNMGFIDRFLVTCEAYEIPAGIIINKMDLASEKAVDVMDDISGLYQGLGYQVVRTSISDAKSISRLSDIIQNETSVFIGPSGVGKTSLLNAIDPDLGLKIGEISTYSDKGKHTTTFARLIPLEIGGFVADTPGIREFGIVNITKPELSLFFPEMAEAREECKFYNCTHFHEPDCGVRTAFEEGKIDADRYHSYLNILESISD
jgi:ribosome biogenesis GTPase